MSAPDLSVVDLYPSLLQPEGDHGNAVALAVRAGLHGLSVHSVVVHPGDDVPAADIYLLGGSEDGDLAACARRLRSDAHLADAVQRGAVVLGVGAGYAALAHTFTDEAGASHQGLGLLDAVVIRSSLASGPVVTRPNAALGLPELSGYEFHYGRAQLGPLAEPLLELEIGVGDGPSDSGSVDGCRQGTVLGTWLHGPLLPRNPELTDLLLRWSRRSELPPAQLDDALAHSVRRARIDEARARRPSTH